VEEYLVGMDAPSRLLMVFPLPLVHSRVFSLPGLSPAKQQFFSPGYS